MVQKVAQCSETNKKINFPISSYGDMIVQSSYNSVFFFISEDAQCSETDLALILTILQFLVYEIW